MIRYYVPTGIFLAFSLGCLFGPKQSDECADYLSCASVVDPDSFAGLSGTYGPKGDCWGGDKESADNCTTACKASVESLGTQFPGVDASCSKYGPPVFEGTWDMTYSADADHDGCSVDGTTGVGTVDYDDGGEPTFHWVAVNTAVDCTYDGSTFDCTAQFGSLEGTGHHTTASGTFAFHRDGMAGVCDSSGEFTAEAQ